MNSLKDFWVKESFAQGPWVHSRDIKVLEKTSVNKVTHKSHSEYAGSKDFGLNDTLLHLGIVPHPFAGDLEKADIFILLLNPGFSPLSYYEQDSCPSYLDAKCRTLRQEFDGVDFPNYHFDPAFAWTSGFQWWVRKFKGVIDNRMSIQKLSYRETLQELSQRVASLELFPYCSKSFGNGKLLEHLPSTLAAKEYFSHTLKPLAAEGAKTVIVARGVGRWDPEHEENTNKIIYVEGGQARAASFGAKLETGKAILRQMSEQGTIAT